MTTTFETGKTYSCRSACDYDCIFTFKVTKRTAKTVTVVDRFGEEKRCKVRNGRDGEWIFPQGQFSMAPVLRAG